MSTVEVELRSSECSPDINNMLPKWFKRTRGIKCGRASIPCYISTFIILKLICIDQLYGWRGIDTGYYGSEELDEDTPDFLDEVQILPVRNEVKDEQLKALQKEAEERIKKEREMRPNFNILTDRAPTPNFSVTYIETSNNADDESISKNQEENIATAIDETGKFIATASNQNNDSDFDEPMEIDDSSYFPQKTFRHSQDVREIVDPNLPKNNSTNLTYVIEKNEDSKSLLLLTDEDRVSKTNEEHEPILELRLDGTFIVEKLHESENIAMIPVQERKKEQCNIPVLDCEYIDEATKNASVWRKMLNERMKGTAHQTLQAADSVNSHHVDEISQPSNQQIFGCPAPLQATFDLSCIDKVDLSTGGKNEISPMNPRASLIPRFDLLKQMGDDDIAHLNTSRLNDRTTVSFKTPKQHMKTIVEHAIVRKEPIVKKQSAITTPLFKKRSVVSTTLRGTSTPVEGSACYICPRYDAHHAAFASHATQTGSGTPVSLYNRGMFQNTLTPVHRPLLSSSHIFCEPHTGKTSTPSRIPIPTSALMAISQYGTPSPLLKRGALVDYELTPQSHFLDKKRTLRQECSTAKPENQSTNSMKSVTQIPLSRFAFEHLKSGGTPRPTSNISEMLVDDVMRSGPACRRRPHPSKLLSPIGKLRFEKSSENSNLLSSCMSPTTKVVQNSPLTAKEAMDDTQLVVIDSFDNDTIEKLTENTANLSMAEQHQSILSEEQKLFLTPLPMNIENRKRHLYLTLEITLVDEEFCQTFLLQSLTVTTERRVSMSLGCRCWRTIFKSFTKNKYTVLNESNVSVNTPGKDEDLAVLKMNPSFSGDSRNPSDTSASPVHIIAAKDENKHAAVLCARKIVHCEEVGRGLRRSARNRVAPIRRWLGEKPVYRRDQQGTYELVRVEEAIVKDPLFIKYNTIDMSEVLERQKREQKQHARARKLRKFDRARRGHTEEDTETSERSRL
ncbi:BMA-HCP-4, isoform b [Dirofilaria immitis]|nr:BMA-HCP-4, isoform b [Dirofilaria immitis]